jgi:hypothetical protein
MKPLLGKIVLYHLTARDVNLIEDKRARSEGALRGNPVVAGEAYPLVISRVWPASTYPGGKTVNGQVILDGNDPLWVTSVAPGDPGDEGTWHEAEGAAAAEPPLKNLSGGSRPLPQ